MSLIDEAADVEKVEDYRATIVRLQRQLARAKNKKADLVEAMYDAIRDGINALDIPDVPKPSRDKRRKHEELAIILLSDWQLGKLTPTYSSEVCAERIEKLASKVASITEVQRSNHPVRRIAVFLLGDMIEGELIFPGQAWQIDSSLYRQIAVDGPTIVSNFIRTMASMFETVDVYAVPGNHGALGGRSRRDYNPESNADRILYKFCEQLTADESRITWSIPDEDYHLVADLGDKLRFMLRHGHQVRGWAGIPWYGWVRRVLGDASMARIWDRYDYDYQAAGHFHTPVSMYVNGRRLWINASTESHNEYAAESSLASAGEPAQWLLYGRPGFGVTAEYLISLM